MMNRKKIEHDSALAAAQRAKNAVRANLGVGAKMRQQALLYLSQQLSLGAQQERILAANQHDRDNAIHAGQNTAFLDRLTLNPHRLNALATAVAEIAKGPEVLGEIVSRWQRPDGLIIERQRVPLGVIAMIFEARPGVVVEAAALAIKSGNVMLLKGGALAANTNQVLAQIVNDSIEHFCPPDTIQLITNKSELADLLQYRDLIDVVIPRGGEALINFVYAHSKIPVIAHFRGLCHLYLHGDALFEQALAISLNAKVQRPGVCNAIETLIIHQDLVGDFLDQLLSALAQESVELRLDPMISELYPQYPTASPADWAQEYLDKILAVKVVRSLEEAIDHIAQYGSHHSEAICTQNPQVADIFVQEVDASCVLVNASTRFNDGGELGLGAELGISTSKLHAYGPMGAREMTTIRFVVRGNGHVRV